MQFTSGQNNLPFCYLMKGKGANCILQAQIVSLRQERGPLILLPCPIASCPLSLRKKAPLSVCLSSDFGGPPDCCSRGLAGLPLIQQKSLKAPAMEISCLSFDEVRPICSHDFEQIQCQKLIPNMRLF